jgi:hypothetical protein
VINVGPSASRPRSLWWRLILACVFAPWAGYECWCWAAEKLGHQPKYRLAWNRPAVRRDLLTIGPWIVVREWPDQRSRSCRVEVYDVTEGSLLTTGEYDDRTFNELTRQLVDHPDLGPNSLLVLSQEEDVTCLRFIQPVTGQERLALSWKANDRPVVFVAAGGRRIIEERTVPLTPFLTLGTNGLADVLGTAFSAFLKDGSWDGVASLALVRVRDSLTGQVVAQYTLPGNRMITNGPQAILSGQSQGKLRLFTWPRHTSDLIVRYFAQHPVPAASERELSAQFESLHLIDGMTGLTVWKPDPASGYFAPLYGGRNGVVLMYSHKSSSPGLSIGAAHEGADDKLWLFFPGKSQPVLLGRAGRKWHMDRGPECYRIVDVERESVDEQNLPSSTALRIADYDASGRRLREITKSLAGIGSINFIDGTNQYYSHESHFPPYALELDKWLERLPWLRFVVGCRETWMVEDLDSGQTHLRLSKRSHERTSMTTSSDNRWLIVQDFNGQVLKELRTYLVPFPDLSWSQRWLPFSAGWAAVGVIAVFLLRPLRRRKREQISFFPAAQVR